MGMMDKKYIPERDFEAASVDLLKDRDRWRERAQTAEADCAFLARRLEREVDLTVRQSEAIKELVAVCRGAAWDIEQAESGNMRYLEEARQDLRRFADKHRGANEAAGDGDPASSK